MSAARTPTTARVTVQLDEPDVEASTPPPPEVTLTRNFVVERLLGEGGMGQVLEARDKRLGRIVAIKRLHESLKRDPRLRGRFVTEAQIGGQLEHPNIVPVYGFELAPDGSPAFVMQLVSGRTLVDYLDECIAATPSERGPNGRFSLKERLSKLLPVCDAIDYAHSRGVVHRDLKPGNVMLGSHHEVLVMDWGIARILDDADASADLSFGAGAKGAPPPTFPDDPGSVDTLAPTLSGGTPTTEIYDPTTDPHAPTVPSDPPRSGPPTFRTTSSNRIVTRIGEVIGTPQYMAPEQAAGTPVEGAADQFALGLMAFELAALTPARNPETMREAYAQAVIGRYHPHVDHRGVPLDPRLSAILDKATAPLSSQRYPSVAEFAQDLRRFIQDEEVSVAPDGRARKLVRHMQAHPVRSVATVMGLLLGLAAVAMASLYTSAQRARQGEEDARHIGRLTSEVARRSRTIEADLIGFDSALTALTAATFVRLQVAPEDPSATWLVPADFDASRVEGALRSPVDGVLRSYEHPVFLFAPDADPTAPAMARKLVGLEPVMMALVLRSIQPDYLRVPPERRGPIFAGARKGLARLVLAFEDGLAIQFPGRGGFPEGFDARDAVWYREAVSRTGTHYTRPKFGAQGKTVRIGLVGPLRSAGRTIGALLAETRLEHVVDELPIPDEPGFRRAFLVSRDGHEIASRELLEGATRAGGRAEAPVNLPRIRSAALLRTLATGAEGGFVIEGDSLYVYDRTTIEDWTYVAEFDRRRYLSLTH